MKRSIEDRFWEKVEKTDGCWLWTASVGARGYAHICHGRRQVPAHRLAYEWLVGPIPEGLEIDHLCRVRHCVNPAHLEPVTHRENDLRGVGIAAQNARKTHCQNGHEFTPENVWVRKEGWRQCRTCLRLQSRKHRRLARDRRGQIPGSPRTARSASTSLPEVPLF